MRKWLLCGLLAIIPLGVYGCSNQAADEGEMKTTAPINNDAPGAATAGAAPVAPGQPPPGGGSIKKKLPGM